MLEEMCFLWSTETATTVMDWSFTFLTLLRYMRIHPLTAMQLGSVMVRMLSLEIWMQWRMCLNGECLREFKRSSSLKDTQVILQLSKRQMTRETNEWLVSVVTTDWWIVMSMNLAATMLWIADTHGELLQRRSRQWIVTIVFCKSSMNTTLNLSMIAVEYLRWTLSRGDDNPWLSLPLT